MDKKKLRRAPLFIAAAAVAPVMLGACGSSAGSSSDAPSSAQGGAGSSSAAQTGQAQFSQCMRQKGVTNFPDPQSGHFVIPGDVKSNPHFSSAIKACQHFMGPGGIGSNSRSNGNMQAELAFVQCMRTHGVPDMPEPASNGAIQAGGSGVDRNSPAFQKAFSECRSKLPGNGKGLHTGSGSGQ